MNSGNPLNDNAVVAMRNDIIPTFAKLRLNESRLFQFCLAHFDSRKGENLTYTATVNDLREYFGLNAKSAYAVVEQAMLKLARKPLRVRTENKKLIAHWFTDVTYHRGDGTFEFRLNDKAAPYPEHRKARSLRGREEVKAGRSGRNRGDLKKKKGGGHNHVDDPFA